MVIKKYDLIICEKEQQGNDIANALNIPEEFIEIVIPTKEFLEKEKKIKSMEIKLTRKKTQIIDFEQKYTSQGKKFSHLKGYQNLINQKDKWEKELEVFKEQLKPLKSNLKTRRINYWKDDSKIIISCLGHLISFQLDGSQSKLNFKIKPRFPSPTNASEVNKWLQLKLIEKYLKPNEINRIICATDYDREGESIFGTIMSYYNIDTSTCLRMKFSTLEKDVLEKAYNNLISFNLNMYNGGKMRRWMDLIIGYNLSPIFAQIYRESIINYLQDQNLTEEAINKIKYDNTFNIGRVKLVIMNYIYNSTKEQLKLSSEIKNEKATTELSEEYSFYYTDHKGLTHYLFQDKYVEDFESIDLDKPIILKIEKIEELEMSMFLPKYSDDDVPSFLNLTKVFQICSDLGASTEEIDRILEYLYLQKYISYPRSKSEKWEIDDEKDKTLYAHIVLEALENCGYPIKKYYYDSYGNEGDQSFSHPCIHPLPSLTLDKVKRLKKTNPLAFLVFNEIVIYTLKCFEKLPLVKCQKILYKLSQDNFTYEEEKEYYIELLEENLLTFEGYSGRDLDTEIKVSVGDEFNIDLVKEINIDYELESNRKKIEILDDFDVIHFLNENDIGTDATRSGILNELIQLQYLVSNNILLTTYLGNLLSKLANRYVEFIDINYTKEIEKDLNEIEKGNLENHDFKTKIKELVTKTYDFIISETDNLKTLFLNMPKCEKHNIPMVIKRGQYGRFFLCPFYFTNENCNQKFSI